MKVILHQSAYGHLMVYVPKKDLEESVVAKRLEAEQTIVTLANGWELSINNLPDPLPLPRTVEAKHVRS
ncbi:putative nitrogen fixation protein NifT [Thermostichus vulcanus]|uniref:Nitrogen fixation protein NifT n=1 Tax=Thermostichus vulcanus str. 'Rupite' TaxID=2813851 RepID=A0ABT0C9A1_THEVL|nr:putative nitrogen fixation protein NifT [Thermostichus vulcanus]MCJ2541930.1 putative nitrogen fixation protein NifT [Thermostichus vulcanus str. 'Rupite']